MSELSLEQRMDLIILDKNDQLEAENAALKEQLASLQKEQSEYLCEKCREVHPVQRRGVIQPCPSCGAAMVPTSFNLRELAALREQLAAAQKDAERYRFRRAIYLKDHPECTAEQLDEATDAAIAKEKAE